MAKNGQYVIGVDLGGTNIMAGLVSEANSVVARNKTSTKAEHGSEKVIGRIAKCVEDLISDAEVSQKDVTAVGIGAPGAVNMEQGVVINAVNLRWNDLPLAEKLSKQLGLPVVLDNDVNVGTWGEYRLGAGRGCRNMLGIFVGTGIGGGIVIDGELYYGHFHTAGEIGHMVINAGGTLGNRTLENVASRTAIVNQLIQLIQSNHPSVIPKLTGGDLTGIRSKVLSQAQAADDALTLRVLREAAEVLGANIASVVTLLSLERVVVGGGLTEALDSRWIKWIRSAFQKDVFPDVCKQCKVLESALDDDAGLLGAALLAREKAGT